LEQVQQQFLHQVAVITAMQVHLIQFQALVVAVAVEAVPLHQAAVRAVVLEPTQAQVAQELQGKVIMAVLVQTNTTMVQAGVVALAQLVLMEFQAGRQVLLQQVVMVEQEQILIQLGQLQLHQV
jgi:hypothetical protein